MECCTCVLLSVLCPISPAMIVDYMYFGNGVNYTVIIHCVYARVCLIVLRMRVRRPAAWVWLVGNEQWLIDSRDSVFEPCGTTANWLGSSWKEDPREINWALAPMDPSKRYLIRTETLSVYDSCLISEIIYFTPLDRSEWSGVCWKEDP